MEIFSVNVTNLYASGNFSGGKEWNETDVDINNNSPQEFLDSDFNKELEEGGEKSKDVTNYNFVEAYEIETTAEQDKIVAEAFREIAEGKYNPVTNNCAIAVQRSLRAAGINISKEQEKIFIPSSATCCPVYMEFPKSQPTAILPTNAFNSIKQFNPNGKHYYKTR